MKTILSLCLLVLIFSGQVFAGGQTGHRVIGIAAPAPLFASDEFIIRREAAQTPAKL